MKFAIEFGNRLILMDEGHIILDISGAEKKKLTVASSSNCSETSEKEFVSDEGLLTT
jgi:putative ABC transport system ATP-binding protein